MNRHAYTAIDISHDPVTDDLVALPALADEPGKYRLQLRIGRQASIQNVAAELRRIADALPGLIADFNANPPELPF